MCGICGFVSDRTISLEKLKEMNDTMFHRGPDDGGEEIYNLSEGFSLGLAQRRLSILDLSKLGHQPMHSNDKRVSLVYNGEIYNFKQVREELQDYEFKSHCDTEVILAAYLKWGIQCVSKFNGMFAIALFDRESDALYLVRDRIGKKPLYYWLDGKNIVFASECKPIMKAPGFEGNINQEVMGAYLIHQYINAPNTIFKNVFKLEPGMILEYHFGENKKYKYWDVGSQYTEKARSYVKSYDEAKETLKELLTDAIEKRMISDVPVGSFLSGGYDSTLVSAIAQSISSKQLKTFSIGFEDPKYNEAKYARAVADYLGTDHTELYIGKADMLKLVESIAAYYDEPFADSSQIPTMLVSGLAREQVTVALSGDGGDELFCGYNMYTSMKLAQRIDILGGMVYGACNLPGIRKVNLLQKMPYRVRTIALNRNRQTKTQYGIENYENAVNGILNEKTKTAKYIDTYSAKDWQVRRMLLDQDTYLPGDILCKVDRAAMKYSLETRCPILDYRVIEYSYRIPHKYKYFQGDKKHILKDIAYDYVPKELLERPKVGFAVPLEKWLRGPLKEAVMDYADVDMLEKQGIFHGQQTRKFIEHFMEHGDKGPGTGENYSKIIWSFFVFEQWYQHYFK